MITKLVWLVCNMFYFSIHWEYSTPFWLSYFSEGWNHRPLVVDTSAELSWYKFLRPNKRKVTVPLFQALVVSIDSVWGWLWGYNHMIYDGCDDDADLNWDSACDSDLLTTVDWDFWLWFWFAPIASVFQTRIACLPASDTCLDIHRMYRRFFEDHPRICRSMGCPPSWVKPGVASTWQWKISENPSLIIFGGFLK